MLQDESCTTPNGEEAPTSASPKSRNRLRTFDRWMRWLHLYTGLFLFPWMLVYCASAFCLNHGPSVTELLGVTPPKWEVEREVDLPEDVTFSGEPGDQAKALLQYLDLDGAHHVPGKPGPAQMIVVRVSGSGNYRITWKKEQRKVLIEQQRPFSWYRLMHFLHFRGGYGQKYTAHVLWAIIVDAVAVSIAIWCLTGIYIWARRPRRLLGGVCVVAGSLLFIGLVAALCS